MIQIFVDADACPVKAEVMRVAERHELRVHFVSNSYMRLPDDPLVNRVIVSEGPDEADNWIADNIGALDLAITADIPLASRCLSQGAAVIGPTGKPFTEANIGNAMAMRDLSAELREAGVINGYNPSFKKEDRSRFLQAMENAVRLKKRMNGL